MCVCVCVCVAVCVQYLNSLLPVFSAIVSGVLTFSDNDERIIGLPYKYAAWKVTKRTVVTKKCRGDKTYRGDKKMPW